MQPTSGSQRVLQAFSWLRLCSAKLALSRPAHQRVTQTVDSTQSELSFSFLWVEFYLPDILHYPVKIHLPVSTHPALPTASTLLVKKMITWKVVLASMSDQDLE
jgi:hypothetical protein